MAIAFDNVKTTYTPSTGVGVSFTTSGTQIGVIVGVTCDTGSGISISSVTYGGQAMTSFLSFSGYQSADVALYKLVQAPVGANNIVVNFTGGTNVAAQAVSYNGITAIGSATAVNAPAGLSTTINVDLTTTHDNSWASGFIIGNNPTAGTATTYRGGSSVGFCDSNSAIHPAGVYRLEMNNNSGGVAIGAFEVAPIFQGAMSDSVSVGASRVATVNKALFRTASDAVLRGASRASVLSRAWLANFSDSIMNAASRFITLRSIGGIWTKQSKSSSTFTNQTKD